MGGFCSSEPEQTPTSTTVVSGTQIPEWVSQGGQELFGQAKSIAKQPYQAYGGQRLAEFSGDENQAFDMARANVGSFAPFVDKAGSLIDRGTKEWSDETAQQYMSPYAKGVTDIAARELSLQHGKSTLARQGKAVAAGAFGGDRHGVVENDYNRQYETALGDTYLKGMGAAYDTARAGFEADKRTALEGAGQTASLGQMNTALQGIDFNTLLQSGAYQRALAQQGMDIGYQDFREQRDYPYENLNFAIGALSGVPFDKGQTQTTTGTQLTPTPSALGQVAGLGLAGAGIYNYLQ